MLTAVLCTARKEPQFQWMADSFVHALNFCNTPVELIVVDKLLWDGPKNCNVCQRARARREELADAIRGRFSFRHVPPKPTAWQGPTRKTKRDFYALTNARNTGIALARGDQIILFDDCSVLDELFLHWHAEGARRGVCVAGAFRSYTKATVEDGKITKGELHPQGIDQRSEVMRLCSGSWMYGLNTSFPLEAALKINGYDEMYDGQGGSEDCFQFSTEIITDSGIRKIGELAGQEVAILSANREWITAPIKKFAKQRLWRIVCQNGHQHTKEIYATENHKWFVKNYNDKKQRNTHIVKTKELRPVHNLAYLTANNALKTKTVPSPFGIAHGIAFGDGCNDKSKTSGKVALYGDKKDLAKYFKHCTKYETKCDGVVFAGLPDYFKALPSIKENTAYLLGWAIGYFAADGSVSKTGSASLSSASLAAIEFFRNACLLLGIECYPARKQTRDTNFKLNSTIYKVTLGIHSLTKSFFLRNQHRERFHGTRYTAYTTTKLNEWKVVAVEKTDRVEDTYCAVVPKKRAFVLEGNILTHNCDFGVRIEQAKYKTVFMPQCIIHQILETHEPVCEFSGWGVPQPRKQKERVLADGRGHFANEWLIQELLRKPRVEPLGNDFNLRELRKAALATGTFPVERTVEVDWRDNQPLRDMK